MDHQPRFRYLRECLGKARRHLMLPFDDEAQEIAFALNECSGGLQLFPAELLDDTANAYVAVIREAGATEPMHEDPVYGSLYRKAENMDVNEKAQIADAIDSLASWADQKYWGAQ